VRDLQRAIGVLAGRGSLSESERRAADVNGNGSLDVGDLVGLVDRVLDRNLLAPGELGSGSLAKDAPAPKYRYDEPEGGGGYGGYEVAGPGTAWPAYRGGYGATFSLVGQDRPAAVGGGVPRPDLALGALQLTFSLPAGLVTPPQVVSTGGQKLVVGRLGSELRVFVLSSSEIPVGVPLFRFVGSVPRLEQVTAATRGGSLRALRADRTSARPAAPDGLLDGGHLRGVR
jgi:hypothetical protein